MVELQLIDRARVTPAIGSYGGADSRLLATTVHLPAGAGPAPLVLLAHGFDGHPRKFTELATHWAAAGYVVAVPEFPVSSDRFADTGVELFSDRISDLAEQAADLTFVLDGVLAAPELAGRIDADRIGLYGLSLGSLTSWIAMLERDENRFDAYIQSDGGYQGEDLAALDEVAIPVFVAHSDVDPAFPMATTLELFDRLASPKFMLVLHRAAHAAVGENTPTPADDAYRAATTVFWDRYLGDRPDEPFPDSIEIDGITSFVAHPGE